MSKKITYVCSSLARTGPVNIIYNLISSSRYVGAGASVITLSGEGDDSRIDDFKALGVEVICLGLSHSNTSLITGRKPLLSALKQINPDVIHGCGFRADIMCSGRIIRRHYAVTSTLQNYPYDDYLMLYGRCKGSIMAWLHIWALKKMTIVSTCSDFIRNKMIDHGAKNFTTIHNGVDGKLFTPSTIEQKAEVKESLGIDPEAIVFIFIGYLIKRKNPEVLVEGFSEFIEKNPKVKSHLIVMGDGPLMESCKEIYDGRNISYIGNQPSTTKWLAMSDVYISCSYSEGFPTAVMEALASGLICVLSNIDPHTEMVGGMGKKYTFGADSKNQLAEKLSEIVSNPAIDSEQVQSRAYFDEYLSSDIMTVKHIEIYNKLTTI